MGYRGLLKKYIRHLELVAGDNYLEAESPEPVLSARDLGELRTLAAEIFREAGNGAEVERVANCNYRLRLLMNRYGLDPARVASLTGTPVSTVRRWRTSPKSSRYLPMTTNEFEHVEAALTRWLEDGSGS